MTTLLGISGSLRKASTNTALMNQAAEIFAPQTYLTADLDLPLYNGDLEAASGIPAKVQQLADQIAAADAVIIVTPEYNKSISGVLKNALDWVSRVEGNPWADKPVAIMSAAAGRAGGERAQYALRLCMTPFGTDIIQTPEVMIGASHSAFDENGALTDAATIGFVTNLMNKLREKT